MDELIPIGFILLQIIITYLVGRVTLRVATGEWPIDEDLHPFYFPYIIGVTVIIPTLLIILGIVKLCV